MGETQKKLALRRVFAHVIGHLMKHRMTPVCVLATTEDGRDAGVITTLDAAESDVVPLLRASVEKLAEAA